MLTKDQRKQDYKSVWEDRITPVIEQELVILQVWSADLDKLVNKEDMLSIEKAEILKDILEDRK